MSNVAAMDWHNLIISSKPNLSRLPAGWEPESIPELNDAAIPVMQVNPLASVIDNLLSDAECEILIQLMQSAPHLAAVNYQGNPKQESENIGSVRVNLWSPELSESIWKKISPYIDPIHADENTLTDWWQGNSDRRIWKPIAISPLMRFMRYEKHGKHLPHYDAGFIYPDDNLRGLVSLIIYLTSHENGGETRMINDSQRGAIWHRNHDDWNREAIDSEVTYSCKPKAGRALLFLHRECHDVAEYRGDTPRIIIRTDILFEAVV